MKIGTEVVLKKFGARVEEFDAIAIGGTENDLSVAYFDANKEALLGGVDWRNAWVRVDQVKHVDHQDVKDGKVGFAWTERGFVDRLFHPASPSTVGELPIESEPESEPKWPGNPKPQDVPAEAPKE